VKHGLWLAAVLLAFASSAEAQLNNCSAPTYQITGSAITAHDCAAFHWTTSGYEPYTETWHFNFQCYNTQSRQFYVTDPTPEITSNAECTTAYLPSRTIDCPPKYDANVYIDPVYPGSPNRIQWLGQTNYIYAQTALSLVCKLEFNGAQRNAYCHQDYCGDKASPIVLDLTGEGFRFTNVADGVWFHYGQKKVNTAWTARGVANAFLCLPDSDGKCDDGSDMFGNFTPQPDIPGQERNGFRALAVYADPKNGGCGKPYLSACDAVWPSLRACRDWNHTGTFEPGECVPLEQVGVDSISLNPTKKNIVDVNGNIERYWGEVNQGQPDKVGPWAVDVFFSCN
jgi:hypothetical protein